MNKKIDANGYLLTTEGDKYKIGTEGSKVLPFHPYFVRTTSGTREAGNDVHSIIFTDEMSQLKSTRSVTDISSAEGNNLLVKAGRKKIVVESQLHYMSDVRIVTPAGITYTTFSIEPEEVVDTRVESSGVYIVYADNGRFVKKVIVK